MTWEDALEVPRVELEAGVDDPGVGDRGQARISTVPAAPSRRTRIPSRSVSVAPDADNTAGSPYSRARVPGCESAPPFSVTRPPMTPKIGSATSIQGLVLTFPRALGFTDDVEVVYRVTDDEGQTAEATATFTLDPTLPETGSDSGLLALFGVLFISVGGPMLQTSRRSRMRPIT